MSGIYTEARDAVFNELFEIALKDERVVLLTVDTGAFLFNKFREQLPDRFFNLGIAEQNAVSVAAGMAMAGLRPYLFGISNFVTLRCFEQFKLDICNSNLPVTVIGMGSGYVYPKDGPTHHMTDAISLIRTIPNITIWSPSSFDMIAACTQKTYQHDGPSFLYMDKGPFQGVELNPADIEQGFSVLREGEDLTLISTGIMVPQALAVADALAARGVKTSLIDLFRIKPVDEAKLLDALRSSTRIAVLEENTIIGGMGGVICELIAGQGLPIPVRRLGIQDRFHPEIGNREEMRALDGIDLEGLESSLFSWINP